MKDEIIRLKNQLDVENKKGIALDIDETLSFSDNQWFEYMLRFNNPEGLSVEELVKKYKFFEEVPFWQTKEALDYGQEILHSNEFQEKLPLIENSNHIVNEINRIVPIVVYITARPEAVRKGTITWLKKHGFPAADVLMRPLDIDFDFRNIWKAQILEELYPEISGIVDNDPKLADNLSKNYKGILYLYDNHSHQRKDIKIVPCKTWENVFDKIKLEYIK